MKNRLKVLVLSVANLRTGGADVTFLVYDGDEFNTLFTEANLPNLAPHRPGTGNADRGALIRDLAEGRATSVAPWPQVHSRSPTATLVQAKAVVAWNALQAAARASEHVVSIHPNYRSRWSVGQPLSRD